MPAEERLPHRRKRGALLRAEEAFLARRKARHPGRFLAAAGAGEEDAG
jgi:hypothetical protein